MPLGKDEALVWAIAPYGKKIAHLQAYLHKIPNNLELVEKIK
jgi:hypothetical protein